MRVTSENTKIPRFRSPKAVALLGYLASEARPISRNVLSTLFWPDKPNTQARGELRRVLHNLSTILPGCLQSDSQTVHFALAVNCQLDAAIFDQLQVEGSLTALKQANDLYQGEFMTGVYLEDSVEFESWLSNKRILWQQRVIQVLETLMSYHENRGEYDDGFAYAQRLVALAPWHEAGHRQIMLLLARSGRRNAALSQYENCCRVLAEELDVEPSTETTALYRRIKTAVFPPRYHLPSQPTPFVGRETELAEIRQMLSNSDCRLLTILGPGGIGKTRLAVQAAQAVADDRTQMFLHGVVFVSLAGLETATLLIPAIAQALGFLFHGTHSPEKQLLNYLSEKDLLLILDNFEHLLPDVSLLVSILEHAPLVKLMTTSQERLSLREEWLFDVTGLPYPNLPESEPGSQEQDRRWQEYGAVQLFDQIARREQRHFSLAETGTAVIQICQLVEGAPLALELAAASVRTMSCTVIVQEIGHNLRLLQTSLRDVPDRHRSMQAVFDHSWQRLTPAERSLLPSLSIFSGGFSPSAAEDVAGASRKMLETFVAKSWLRRSSTDRYEMHELLRYFAAEKLNQDSEKAAAVYGRHGAYYASFLQRQGKQLKTAQQSRTLQEIDEEMQNVHLAWHQLVAQDQVALLERCLDGLFLHFDLCGRHKEGEVLLQTAVTELAPNASTILLARLKTRLARFIGRQARYDEALQLLQESTAVFHDDRAEMALALYLVGVIQRQKGAYEAAEQALQKSLELYQVAERPWETARTLNILADAVRQLGEYHIAQKYCQESLNMFTKTGDRWGKATALYTLGLTAYETGDYDTAQHCYRESLAIKQEIGDKWSTAALLNSLGIVTYDLGHYDEAESYYEKSLELAQELGSWERVAATLNNLGVGAAKQQAYKKARGYYRQSLAICRRIGDQRGEAIALANLGSTAFSLVAYAEARQYLEESLQLKQAINYTRGTAYALIYLGHIDLAQGNHVAARLHYREAIALTHEAGALPRLLDAMVGAAALLSQTNQRERAIQLLAFILNQSGYEKSTQERAERLMAELAQQVTPPRLEHARAKGEAARLSAVVHTLLTGWL